MAQPTRMLRHFAFPVLLLAVVNIAATQQTEPRVLVFSKTTGFRHSSIETGIAAVQRLGGENGFAVEATEDASAFTERNLKRFRAVVFLNTTGDILDARQQDAFERYIQAGGGWVGVHAAADTEYDWPWYGRLAGAYFESHPNDPNVRKGTFRVLVDIDERSYQGGTNGDRHPMSWYHAYDGGRAFYTSMGHTDASFAEPLFLRH